MLGGMTLRLAPGAYKNVVVQPGGTLELHGFIDANFRRARVGQVERPRSYVYVFESLTLLSSFEEKSVSRHAKAEFILPQDLVANNQASQRRARDFAVGMQVWVTQFVKAQAGTKIRPSHPGHDASLFKVHLPGGTTQPALDLGEDVQVHAFFSAPSSTIALGNRMRGIGQFVGKTITVGADSTFSRKD